MDYLDPRKRRAYHIRLMIGYALMAVVILLGTVILVYGANGYGINTKTGQIVQNGLLFADSKPGGAEIFLNGVDQHDKTGSRIVLPSGNYTLTMQKDGYRNWTRKFTLNEQSIARYIYPFLFPAKPTAVSLKPYSETPGLFTQSPDRRWILLQVNVSTAKTPTFEEFDSSTFDQATPDSQSLAFPTDLLTDYSPASKLTVVEWSTDNNHVLLRHEGANGVSEFVVFDRNRPDQSFNINTLFNISPDQVSMRDKKTDQLYIFDEKAGTLQMADVGNKTIDPPLIKKALAYKPYAKNLIIYVTNANEPSGKVAGKIWDNGQTYSLNEFNSGNKYLIDAAQFQGHFYYVVTSNTADRINIYKDPVNDLKNPALAKALPILALHNPGANKISFSQNTRFIEVENGQRFAVFDIETQSSYQYPLQDPIAADLVWMDGHRLMGLSNGNVFVMDYDGTNKQTLTPSIAPFGGLFSRDYNHLITLVQTAGGYELQNVDMRAGVDLPKR